MLITFSCNSDQNKNESAKKSITDSTHVSDNLSKGKSKENLKDIKDLHKFIKNFSEKDFIESRKQLIAEGKEFDYKISEIKHLGNILKYDVVIPGIDGKMEYTCNPERGEFEQIMIGDKDIATMYFNQYKVGLYNANCNKTDIGEQCEADKDWGKEYSLTTHFITSITNTITDSGEVTTFLFKRQIMPK